MDIHGFPLEVYERIFQFLDPASHLDLALADKHLYTHAHNILEHHQKCHESFQIYNDWRAESLARALRVIAVDHIAAWHVRTVRDAIAKDKDLSSPVDDSELSALVDRIHATMVANDIPVFGLEEMRRGNQEALQVALMALSPQLHTFHTRHFSGFYEESDTIEYEYKEAVEFFSDDFQ